MRSAGLKVRTAQFRLSATERLCDPGPVKCQLSVLAEREVRISGGPSTLRMSRPSSRAPTLRQQRSGFAFSFLSFNLDPTTSLLNFGHTRNKLQCRILCFGERWVGETSNRIS